MYLAVSNPLSNNKLTFKTIQIVKSIILLNASSLLTNSRHAGLKIVCVIKTEL